MSKLCVSCVMTSCMCDDGRRREEEEAAGYRTKNKNPTQRCGEISIYGASNLPGSSISILGFQKLVQCVARGFQVWLPNDISALQCAGG